MLRRSAHRSQTGSVGLELSDGALRLARVELLPLRLTDAAEVPLDTGVVEDGTVQHPPAIAEAIAAVWRRLKLDERAAHVCVGCSESWLAMLDGDVASPSLPDKDDYLVHAIHRPGTLAPGAVVIAPRPPVEHAGAGVAAAGLTVLSVETVPVALLRLGAAGGSFRSLRLRDHGRHWQVDVSPGGALDGSGGLADAASPPQLLERSGHQRVWRSAKSFNGIDVPEGFLTHLGAARLAAATGTAMATAAHPLGAIDLRECLLSPPYPPTAPRPTLTAWRIHQ